MLTEQHFNKILSDILKKSKSGNILFFSLNEKPVGKQRPRIGKSEVFTPKKTIVFENLIKWTAVSEIAKTKFKLIPINKEVLVVFKVFTPKVISTPDIDNIEKSILDSLNKIAYDDDRQVTTVLKKKFKAKDYRIEIYILEY